MKKSKLRVIMYMLLAAVVVLSSTFCGYLADKVIYLEAKSAVLSTASALVVVSRDISSSDYSLSQSDLEELKNISENISLIMKYEIENNNLVPEDYEWKLEFVENTSVLKIEVVGADGNTCVNTANQLAGVFPETIETYVNGLKVNVLDYADNFVTEVEVPERSFTFTIICASSGILFSAGFVIIFEFVIFRNKQEAI